MLEGWKTFIGLAVAAVAQASSMFGIDIGDVAGVSNSLVTLIGLGVALYGRAVANGPMLGGDK